MRTASALVVVLGVLVVGCAPSNPSPTSSASAPVDVAADEQAIRDLDARWQKAVESRDAAAEIAMFASDGKAYRRSTGPLDRAAYEAYLIKDYADNPKSVSRWSTNRVQVASSGDFAFQTGEYHLTGVGPTGEGEDRGPFVTVWKKVDGEWRVAHDMSTSAMPSPPPQ